MGLAAGVFLAGFFVTAFLTALEARDLPYIIVARLTPLVRKLVIHRIPEADWQLVTRGIAVADVMATLPAWRAPSLLQLGRLAAREGSGLEPCTR